MTLPDLDARLRAALRDHAESTPAPVGDVDVLAGLRRRARRRQRLQLLGCVAVVASLVTGGLGARGASSGPSRVESVAASVRGTAMAATAPQLHPGPHGPTAPWQGAGTTARAPRCRHGPRPVHPNRDQRPCGAARRARRQPAAGRPPPARRHRLLHRRRARGRLAAPPPRPGGPPRRRSPAARPRRHAPRLPAVAGRRRPRASCALWPDRARRRQPVVGRPNGLPCRGAAGSVPAPAPYRRLRRSCCDWERSAFRLRRSASLVAPPWPWLSSASSWRRRWDSTVTPATTSRTARIPNRMM